MRARGRLGQFPIPAEQIVKVAHVELERLFCPRTFYARREGVRRLAVLIWV